MIYVQVFIRIKPGKIKEFIEATLDNANNSIKEEGIRRFDFLQEVDRPDHILLSEIYKDSKARERHRQSLHFKKWCKIVETIMVESKKIIEYKNIFPGEE